jgi:hypothetical protein
MRRERLDERDAEEHVGAQHAGASGWRAMPSSALPDQDADADAGPIAAQAVADGGRCLELGEQDGVHRSPFVTAGPVPARAVRWRLRGSRGV